MFNPESAGGTGEGTGEGTGVGIPAIVDIAFILVTAIEEEAPC